MQRDQKRRLFPSIVLLISLVLTTCGPPTPTATHTPATLVPPTMAVEGPTTVPLPPTSTPAPAPTLLPYLAVPDAYASIQAAIDAAQNGDLIVVSPGTYRENVDFSGKNITVRSTDPDDPDVVAATIIDGGGEGSVVTFQNGETVRAVLAGFTITNGRGNLFLSSQEQGELACRGSVFGSGEERRFCGGGIVVVGSWPTIEKNVITANRTQHGGGIFVASSSFL